MLIEELYDYYGTWTNMVRTLNLGNSTYQIWKKQGYIPFTAQLLIENRTKGFFKACESHGKPVVKKKGKGSSIQKEKSDSTTSS